MNFKSAEKSGMTEIVYTNYVKLILRLVLFLSALSFYIYNRVQGDEEGIAGFGINNILLICIWLVFFTEMILREFPARLESMGCQKQFGVNYIEADTVTKQRSKEPVLAVVISWTVLNVVIGIFYILGVLDKGIMLLISLFYSVCDIICILFFCPFRVWMMKNKCCVTCRIYNWDYAMMFTPLVFVCNIYSYTLTICAIILLIRWELTFRRHPERFSEDTNKALSCEMCNEKLCRHRKWIVSKLKNKEGV